MFVSAQERDTEGVELRRLLGTGTVIILYIILQFWSSSNSYL